MLAELLVILATLLAWLFLRFRYRSNHWTRLGIRQVPVNPFPLGNNPLIHPDFLMQRKNHGDVVQQQCEMFPDDRYFGTYALPHCEPILMIKDPDLVRDIFVKDFGHFVDRSNLLDFFGRDGPTKTDHAWQKQLTNSKGDEWKDMRSIFSPIFTSGKLKMMTHFMNLVSKELEKELEAAAKSGKELDLKKSFGKFSMETVASCAFGIETGSFNVDSTEETEFVRMAKTVFTL